jgi:hypothetical protein
MLPIQDIQALLKACQTEQNHTRYSKTAQRIVDALGFGRIVGQRWLLSDTDKQRIKDYLASAEGIDPGTPPDAWQGRSRIEAAGLGKNEKLAGRRPREGRVAVRAPTGLHLGDTSVKLPDQAFLDLPADSPVAYRHDALIVVENFEAFIGFENCPIDLPFASPLLVFRGDAINPPDAVLAFIRRTELPVVVWADFDPAGLLIASTTPRCQGIIAPTSPVTALKDCGRSDLFLSQLTQLDALKLVGECAGLGHAMREGKTGIDQERMIAKQVPLRLWSLIGG